MTFGGSFGQLNLPKQAIQAHDFGRVGKMFEDCERVSDIIGGLGTVIINTSTWVGDAPTMLDRCDKDAEIVAVALHLYWTKDDRNCKAFHDSLIQNLRDIPFDAREMGTGSQLDCNILRLSQQEESKREVLGCSAHRMCVMLMGTLESVTMLLSIHNLF